MDLRSLITGENQKNNIIEKGADVSKYTAIAEKLCSKRMLLEHTLAQDLPLSEHEETLSSLTLLKESMATFGISEIDYQAYRAKNAADEEQLSLF